MEGEKERGRERREGGEKKKEKESGGGGEERRVEGGGKKRESNKIWQQLFDTTLNLEVSTISLLLMPATNGIRPLANPISLRAWHYSLL